MPYSIPIPKGLQLPDLEEGETIDLPVTFSLVDGALYANAVDGVQLEAEQDEDMPEAGEAGEAAEADEESFMQAVERGMQ